MINRIYLVAVFVFCCFAVNVSAMSQLTRAISKGKTKKFEVISDDIELERITKLIEHTSKLSHKKQIELALLCMASPQACVERNLFKKVSPDLFLPDNTYFVHALFLKGHDNKNYVDLLREVLKESSFNPHFIKLNAQNSDLAFEILMQSDVLTDYLMVNGNFSPNAVYEVSKYCLATKLQKAKNYEALSLIMGHPKFDRTRIDNHRFNVAHYLLESATDDDKKSFKLFMGDDLSKWNLLTMDLELPQMLDNLFAKFLDNNHDRLVVFEIFIKQWLITWEKNEKSAPALAAILSLLSTSSSLSVSNYINKDFAYSALKMLNDYQILTRRDVDELDYWLKDSYEKFGNTLLKTMISARKKHRCEGNDEQCSICEEKIKGHWYKSTNWCDHTFCLDCWKNFYEANTFDEELVCPAKDCNYFLPPSHVMTIATATLESGDFAAFDEINSQCYNLHQKISEGYFAKIPGFKHCPKCSEKLVFDVKNKKPRLLSCPECDNKFVFAPKQNEEILPLSHFADLGCCNTCGTLVDKVDGCENIRCPVCKIATKWVPIQ